jgi:hypothetical protein
VLAAGIEYCPGGDARPASSFLPAERCSGLSITCYCPPVFAAEGSNGYIQKRLGFNLARYRADSDRHPFGVVV